LFKFYYQASCNFPLPCGEHGANLCNIFIVSDWPE
jgi:hypothetical protein